MYVTEIVEDNWTGNRKHTVRYECDDPAQVATAVRRLNGKNKTTVIFVSRQRRSLTVSGGNDGRYIVYLAVGDDEQFYNLVNVSSRNHELEVVTGGQCGLYPARRCVNLVVAIQAATQFAEDGSMLKSLTWECAE